MSGVETQSELMRKTAREAADIASQISTTMNGLDGGLAGMMQTVKGLIQQPLNLGHTNSVDAFARLSRTLSAVADNITLSANKYDAMDADNQMNLARHTDPIAGGGPGAGIGASGMDLTKLT
jgi:hypothetical protein